MTAVESVSGTAAASIAEASKATGVPIETLRYYEKIGLTPSIHRSEGGQRLYSDDDLGWISFVRRLRATGMPVRRVAEYTTMVRAGNGTVADRRRFLEDHRETVRAALTELEDTLDALDDKIAHYEAVEAGDELDCSDAPLRHTTRLG